MGQGNLLQLLQDGNAPRNLRMLVARGSAPLPPAQTIEILVCLSRDDDPEVAACASQTLASWNEEEITAYLRARECPVSVLEYFAVPDRQDSLLEAVIANPATPAKSVEEIALVSPEHLLEKILDNRVRILEYPEILQSLKKNPCATAEIRRIAQEIEVEFLGSKKTDYSIEESPAPNPPGEEILPDSVVPLEELFLEGLPVDPEARQVELTRRISSLSPKQKIQYALFGNREIRSLLVRDSNKDVARSVLRSPKVTENEIESIAAMRGVAEDILREIGNSKTWTRSYVVVQNLVRNPKTPPSVSQRLIFRLRARDLAQISKDRSIPDAVRHNATRALNQRTRPSR
jgi:uncharacterized protein (UPF0147 family)